MNGELWYSGPATSWTPLSFSRNALARSAGSGAPSAPSKMSFGRPVLPPEANAFQVGDTRTGSSGASLIDGSGSKPIGTCGRPP